MAEALGVSLSGYRNLERGRNDNPPLRVLMNAAIVLDVPLSHLMEPEWSEWYPSPRAPSPPDPEDLWDTAPWAGETAGR